MNDAFTSIFAQGMWIIVASIIAFLVSQLVNVTIFRKIKKVTGEKKVWLRATGSTVVSQLVDSFIVVFIAFKIRKGWSWSTVLSISLWVTAINFSCYFNDACNVFNGRQDRELCWSRNSKANETVCDGK